MIHELDPEVAANRIMASVTGVSLSLVLPIATTQILSGKLGFSQGSWDESCQLKVMKIFYKMCIISISHPLTH